MATAVTTHVGLRRQRSPLVLWHLLSLDAPSVAACWCWFLARQFGLAMPVVVPLALGIAVWLLYAGDRIQDALNGESCEERHSFHFQHRRAYTAAGCAVAGSLACLLTLLPSQIRNAWLVLAVPLALYMALIHLSRLHRVPKEPLVAAFFGCAICAPARVAGVSAALLIPAAISFAGLCWLNCIGIASWEGKLHVADPCTAWLGRHFVPAACATMLLTCPLLTHTRTVPVGASILSASACLILLDRARPFLDRTTTRALADAALLTPLPVTAILTAMTRA